jgi:hypothetical protein
MGKSIQTILQSGCDCNSLPLFVDSHHGHVISANLDILSRPNLIELFSRGTKFRRAFLSRLSFEEAIEKGLTKFVNKQEGLLQVPRDLECLSFSQNFCDLMNC